MRPSQLHRLIRRLAAQQPIDEPGCESVAAADAVQHPQLGRRRRDRSPIHPCHGAPAVVICVVHLAQRRRHNLRLWEPQHHLLHHPQERARIQLRASRLRARRNLRPMEPKPLLQVFLVADQHVNILDNLSQNLVCALHPALRLPQFLAVVQVQRRHHAGLACRLHRLNHQRGSGLRQ